MKKIKYHNMELLSSLMGNEAFQDLEHSVEILRQQRNVMKKMLCNAPQNTSQEKALEEIQGLLKKVNNILISVDRLN